MPGPGHLGSLVAVGAVMSMWALPPAQADDPRTDQDVQRVVQAFNAAYTQGDYACAIDAGRKLVEARPDDATAQYNLACVYALAEQPTPALKWLNTAAENGFHRFRLAKSDRDLASLHGQPEFRAALERMRKHQDEHWSKLRKRYAHREPIVVLPPNYRSDKPTPLIITLHGYGGRADEMVKAWRSVARETGAILLAPQALRPAGPRGYNWGDIDEADALIEFTLERARKEHKLDEQCIILSGFSQGAYIAAALGARHPDRFCGVIPVAAPYIPALDAPREANGKGSPRFYFMVGEYDKLLDQCRRAARDYESAGYRTKLHIYAGVGHSLPRNTDAELRAALRYVLSR